MECGTLHKKVTDKETYFEDISSSSAKFILKIVDPFLVCALQWFGAADIFQWPLLLTWFNFNPSMYK